MSRKEYNQVLSFGSLRVMPNLEKTGTKRRLQDYLGEDSDEEMTESSTNSNINLNSHQHSKQNSSTANGLRYYKNMVKRIRTNAFATNIDKTVLEGLLSRNEQNHPVDSQSSNSKIHSSISSNSDTSSIQDHHQQPLTQGFSEEEEQRRKEETEVTRLRPKLVGVLQSLEKDQIIDIVTSLLDQKPILTLNFLSLLPKPTLKTVTIQLQTLEKRLQSSFPYTKWGADHSSDYAFNRVKPVLSELLDLAISYLHYFTILENYIVGTIDDQEVEGQETSSFLGSTNSPSTFTSTSTDMYHTHDYNNNNPNSSYTASTFNSSSGDLYNNNNNNTSSLLPLHNPNDPSHHETISREKEFPVVAMSYIDYITSLALRLPIWNQEAHTEATRNHLLREVGKAWLSVVEVLGRQVRYQGKIFSTSLVAEWMKSLSKYNNELSGAFGLAEALRLFKEQLGWLIGIYPSYSESNSTSNTLPSSVGSGVSMSQLFASHPLNCTNTTGLLDFRT